MKCVYVLLWVGENGRTVHSYWNLREEANKRSNVIFSSNDYRICAAKSKSSFFTRYKFYHEVQNVEIF